MVILDGLPFLMESVDSSAFARHVPVPYDWSRNLTSEEVRKTQHAIAAALERGGAAVNPGRLAPLIRGEEMPSPDFLAISTGRSRTFAQASEPV